MKYLGIHKILWCLIVTVYTLFQFVFVYLLANIVHFIWCFKWTITWESLQTYQVFNKITHGIDEVPYGDKNIFQTIRRRYKCEFW